MCNLRQYRKIPYYHSETVLIGQFGVLLILMLLLSRQYYPKPKCRLIMKINFFNQPNNVQNLVVNLFQSHWSKITRNIIREFFTEKLTQLIRRHVSGLSLPIKTSFIFPDHKIFINARSIKLCIIRSITNTNV